MLQAFYQLFAGCSCVISLLVLVLAVISSAVYFRSSSKLPPGPCGWPLVGCVWNRMLNRLEQHYVFFDWAKSYGQLISFRIGSSLVVVANDRKTILQVLNSKELSGRPDWITMAALSAEGHNMAFQNDEAGLHRSHRRLLTLNKTGMIEQVITEEGGSLCREIESSGLNRNLDPSNYINLAVFNILYTLMFGKRWERTDPTYEQFFTALYPVVDSLRCTEILNTFPWMRFVPGTGARSRWHKIRENCKTLWNCVTPSFREAVDTFDEEEKNNLLVSQFLAEAALDHPGDANAGVQCLAYDEIVAGLDEDQSHFSGSNIQGTLLDALVAGTITTCSSLLFIILHLVAYPQIQQQIREDIATHVTDQPKWSMRENGLRLNFAVVKEILRKYRNVPLPHCAVKDKYVDGYLIPKGTVVLVNMWVLMNDETVWKDPHQFNPYRFMDTTNSDTVKENWLPFSTGSRGCVGHKLAEMELFLLTAMLVKKFKFEATAGCKPDLDPDPTSRVMRVKQAGIVISHVD